MEPKQYTTEEILEMLKKANSKSLLKFITDRVKEDESLRQALGQFLDQPTTKTFDAKDFEEKILKSWIRAFENVDGKWRYNILWDTEFIEKLQKILKRVSKESDTPELRISLELKFLENFKIRKNYRWEIFEKISDDIIQDFGKILENSNEAEGHLTLRKYLFDACLTHLRKYKVLTDELDNRGKLESFLIETFPEEFTNQIKEYINTRMRSIKTADADYWDKYRWLKGYVLKMLDLHSRNNASDEELLCYAKDYFDNQDIRDWFISYFKSVGEWDKAIEVLEESIKQESWFYRIPNYRKEIKELCLLNGNHDKYRKILLEEFKEFKGELETEMEMYQQLKSLYAPEEWTKVRETIFDTKANNLEILAQYFVAEDLPQRLSKLLLAEDTSYAFFDKYAYALPQEYSEQILAKYEKHFANLILKAKDRVRYKELMNTLKDAHKIDGGKQLTERLTTEWLKKYENRPSLCEEIIKFQNECKSTD